MNVSLILILVLVAFGQTSSSNVDWPFYGNDLGNMRYASLDQINPGNVAALKPAWIFHTGIVSTATSFESQPIVLNGTMFVTSPHDHVFALNAATGALKWSYTPEMPPLSQLSICCGQTNRGVAVGDGKVFLGQLDATLVALDANTGSVVWKTTVDPWQEEWTETMAPQFVNGKVIIGASGGEFRLRGHVSAYDSATGKMLWRFFTVPGPGEPGNETWTGDSWKSGAGTVWTTPAVDPQLNMVYITTSNAGSDENGSERAGDNLYTCSVVAIDLNTGAHRWHFQEVHHDIWDYDATQPAHLFTMQRNGQQIPAIGHANKDGYYFILDRRNGAPLFPVNEVPVPTEPSWQKASPTQPIPTIDSLIPHSVDVTPPGMKSAPFWTPPSEQPVIIQPGFEGGPEWSPAAYSPRTGFSYIPAGGYEPWIYKAIPQILNGLGSVGTDRLPGVTNYGLLDAINTSTGKMAWQLKTPEKITSGVVVAGDLVFFGESQGKFNALDAKTGSVLWSFEIPPDQMLKDAEKTPKRISLGGANGSPAAYMINGREYVVMAFGGNTQVRSNAQVSTPGDALIAFALPAANASADPNIVVANVKDVDTGEIPDTAKISGQPGAPEGFRVIEMQAHDFNFFPDKIKAAPGEQIAIHLVNTDIPGASIAFQFPSGPLALRDPVPQNQNTYFAIRAPGQTGTFDFFNPLGSAKALGMLGTITVGP